jgi:hypothetical protein
MVNSASKEAEKVACGSLMSPSIQATCSQDDNIRFTSLKNELVNDFYTSESQSYKSCVAADEVVHGVSQIQLADGREHASTLTFLGCGPTHGILVFFLISKSNSSAVP